MLFDRHPEYKNRYGRHFWARGYYVETVGSVNEEVIRKYIAEQERKRSDGRIGTKPLLRGSQATGNS